MKREVLGIKIFPLNRWNPHSYLHNWTIIMKLSTYFAIILILSMTLVCLVSADGVHDQNTPGQQTHPNITNKSSLETQPDNQKTAYNQPGLQAGGQNGMQTTPTPTQNTQGVPQPQNSQIPGPSGSEVTRQQVSQPTPESQKISNEVPTHDMNQNKPVSPTVQPTQKPIEPGQLPTGSSSSDPPGAYRNIQFPHTYPAVKPNNAAIQVTSNPTGASVFLDGSYKGTTPSSGYLDISDLSPGTYTIRLTSSGYTDYSTEISLSRNQVATISADLTKKYVPSEYGALSLQSNPAGAEVYLDNGYKGITPLTLQGVSIGSHTILIKEDGYSEYSGDVNIAPDQASGLSVTLTGIVTAAPTSIPEQPPVPVPTKSPLSPWVVLCGLVLAGLGFAVGSNRK